MADIAFEYQSNDKYPWEYENTTEVWVANFSIKKSPARVEPKPNPVMEASFIKATDDGDVINDYNEEVDEVVTDEKIKALFEQSVQSRDQQLAADEARQQFSWTLAAVILLVVVVAGEIVLHDLNKQFFWTTNTLLLFVWLWRLCLLTFWLYLARVKWQLNTAKVYATAVASFVLAVIVSAIWKIVVVKSVWTWLNLITEPIWMILIIALVGSLLTKKFFHPEGDCPLGEKNKY